MCDVIIKKQPCGCKDYLELRVAFGDLNNCQLKCPFCFTLGQKPDYVKLSSLTTRITPDIKVVRFTGGEPLLNQNQVNGMIRELRKIEEMNLNHIDLIVIQTNAISAESLNIDRFFELKLPILFEVSFKGTNYREYQYLTYSKPINRNNAERIMKMQLRGYMYISKKCASVKNISILARLGIFHSSLKEPTFKFVFPDTRKLMFDPNNWASEIYQVLQDQNRIWGDLFENKFVIERLKTPADGRPAMGKRYRYIIEKLKSKKLLIESKSKLACKYQVSYYYKRGNVIYQKIASSLH